MWNKSLQISLKSKNIDGFFLPAITFFKTFFFFSSFFWLIIQPSREKERVSIIPCSGINIAESCHFQPT